MQLRDSRYAREDSSEVSCCRAEVPEDAPRDAPTVLAARYSAQMAGSVAASIRLLAGVDLQDGLKALA